MGERFRRQGGDIKVWEVRETRQDGDLHDMLHGELAGAGGEDGILEEAEGGESSDGGSGRPR